MKRFLTLVIVAALLVSLLGIATAFASASISGHSEVYAGTSHTYTGKASYTCGDLVGKIEGLGQANNFGLFPGGMTNISQAGETSITVTIPSSAKPGDTFTIKFSGEYSIFADDGSGDVVAEKSFSTSKTITVVAKPVSTPKPTRDPNATPRPTPEPEGWDLVKIDVDKAEDGTTIQASMEGDTKIPESVLELLAKKKTPLEVDFGTYQCTIDPDDLSGFEGIGSLDLGLTFDKNEALSEVAGGVDVYQLHFAHEGQLPGKFTFSFKAENNKPGDVLYLYYYYGVAGVTEGVQQATVDADGMVTFDIYHCSSYIVTSDVIDGAVDTFDKNKAAEIETLNEELNATKADLVATQAELEEARQAAEAAEAAAAAKDVSAEQNPDASSDDAASAKDGSGIPLAGFIAAVAGAALASMFLTMLFTRSGMFRRSEKSQEKKDAKDQAKREKAAQRKAEKTQAMLDKATQKRAKKEKNNDDVE